MKRIFTMAVALVSCVATALEELDRTATPPEPRRVELGALEWSLPDGAELLPNGILRVKVAKSGGTVKASAPVDLTALSGRSVRMRIPVAACDLESRCFRITDSSSCSS